MTAPADNQQTLDRFRSYLLLLARRQLQGHAPARLDASDLVQQTLLEAHRQREHFRGATDGERAAWLRQILAHNLADANRARGMPCDTHGDLHLDHVYLFPDKGPPDDMAIIDCIEFNERFRFADPVADMAFLVMDLLFHGRRDLAEAFADAYFQAANDAAGRALLSFYVAYRAAVRAKVEGIELQEMEIPEDERRAALKRAQAHWLLALDQLA
jgi:aminoglycoside phosphotransferase family enzyme